MNAAKDHDNPANIAPSPEAVKQTPEESERTARIRIKNRRKMYLDRHPSYFESPDLELAGLSILETSSLNKE